MHRIWNFHLVPIGKAEYNHTPSPPTLTPTGTMVAEYQITL